MNTRSNGPSADSVGSTSMARPTRMSTLSASPARAMFARATSGPPDRPIQPAHGAFIAHLVSFRDLDRVLQLVAEQRREVGAGDGRVDPDAEEPDAGERGHELGARARNLRGRGHLDVNDHV